MSVDSASNITQSSFDNLVNNARRKKDDDKKTQERVRAEYNKDIWHNNVLGVNFSNIFQTDAAEAEAKAAGVELSGATGFLQILLSPLTLATNIIGKVFSFLSPALGSLGNFDTSQAGVTNPLFTPNGNGNGNGSCTCGGSGGTSTTKTHDSSEKSSGSKKTDESKKSDKPDSEKSGSTRTSSGINADIGSYRYGSGVITGGYEKASTYVRSMLEERNESSDDLNTLENELRKAKSDRAAINVKQENADKAAAKKAKIEGFQASVTKFERQLEAITRDIAAQNELLKASDITEAEKAEIKETIGKLNGQEEIIKKSLADAKAKLEKAESDEVKDTSTSDDAKKAGELDGKIAVLEHRIERAKARKTQTEKDLKESVDYAHNNKEIRKNPEARKERTAEITSKLDDLEKNVRVEIPNVEAASVSGESPSSTKSSSASGSPKPAEKLTTPPKVQPEEYKDSKGNSYTKNDKGEYVDKDGNFANGKFKVKNSTGQDEVVAFHYGHAQPKEDAEKISVNITNKGGSTTSKELRKNPLGLWTECLNPNETDSSKKRYKNVGTEEKPFIYTYTKTDNNKKKRNYQVTIINGKATEPKEIEEKTKA